MKLIVGLGNPGKKYEKSRHNAGFIFVDALLKQVAATTKIPNVVWKYEKKVKCDVARFNDIILAKPQTFMNRSGEAILLLLNYYKCGINDLIVAHDDIDLKEKQVKFKRNVGSGGHNGVKDIIAKIGTKDFFRLRFGVGRPAGNNTSSEDATKAVKVVKNFVLSNLSDEEVSFIKAFAKEKTFDLLPK